MMKNARQSFCSKIFHPFHSSSCIFLFLMSFTRTVYLFQITHCCSPCLSLFIVKMCIHFATQHSGVKKKERRKKLEIFKSFNYFNQILYHFDVETLIMLPVNESRRREGGKRGRKKEREKNASWVNEMRCICVYILSFSFFFIPFRCKGV